MRLLLSSVVGLVGWLGLTAILMELLLPPVPIGEDDLGAGLLAAAIFLQTLSLAVVGIAAFNLWAWRAEARKASLMR